MSAFYHYILEQAFCCPLLFCCLQRSQNLLLQVQLLQLVNEKQIEFTEDDRCDFTDIDKNNADLQWQPAIVIADVSKITPTELDSVLERGKRKRKLSFFYLCNFSGNVGKKVGSPPDRYFHFRPENIEIYTFRSALL